MYTDEDLDQAVTTGIFTTDSVQQFRSFMAEQTHTRAADEENFRLVASFNDIFVVIACALLLLSVGWATHAINAAFSAFLVAAISWGLTEFFVRQRKMALPAIALLMAFVGSSFESVLSLFAETSEKVFALAASAAAVAAWLHWRRFRVPITVAAGAAAVGGFIISLLISLSPSLLDYLMYLILIAGMVIFYVAMRWDAADLQRVTGKSDVAFWLHLTAAPLIVHPVFSSLGILDGNESAGSIISILCLYLLLTLVSVTIDRRAFMVSSLLYVLAALTELLRSYGFAADSFAYVGVFIGFSLLLLSGFWHRTRHSLVQHLPLYIRQRVPAVIDNRPDSGAQ